MYYKLKAPCVPEFEASGGHYNFTPDNYGYEGAAAWHKIGGWNPPGPGFGFTKDRWRHYFNERTEIVGK